MNDKFNKEVKRLRPFTRFLYTIGELPSSYLFSMTYEEQLIWFCNYLEKTVIPTVNNNAEAIIELQDLFVELKNYVDNYFSDLDVQEEINNKLDDMAESGELVSIISEYLQMGSILAFDTMADLKACDNVIAGTVCKTLGYTSYDDKMGNTYLVREKEESDVIDDINIVGLTNYPLLVAELIDERENIIYSTISDLKADTTLFDGKKVYTLGYHEIGDNGAGKYLIRQKLVSDVVDEGSVVGISDDLVAELIIDSIVNVKQFGAYGNKLHDDSTAISNAITYISTHYNQEGIYTMSNPTLFFPYGEYLIESPIDIGIYSFKIVGENSILITENSNNCFNFGDYSMHPLYIEGIVFNGFNRAININALNIDRSRSEITKCEFWECSIAIFNNNPSSILKVDNSTFVRCDKIVNNNNADSIIFDTCWFSDKVYANNEDVSIIQNSGTMRIENCFFIPAGQSQTATKLAWIEMTANSNEKRLYINNCRISAETGYKTLVNYKVTGVEAGSPGLYTISITNCPMISAAPMIRLYKLCNNIIIENNNFNAIGNKIIDVDSSLTITDDSYGGLANGFMYDNRIIIKNNHSINNAPYNEYPSSLVDITECDFDIYKSGQSVSFYLGSSQESASIITQRQTYLVKGTYWLDTAGSAGARQFIGLVHLYSSGGYLYSKYQNLTNDNESLAVTTSFNGTEVHDGNVTQTYTDAERIYLNGTGYYLKTTLNIKSNYSMNVYLKKI